MQVMESQTLNRTLSELKLSSRYSVAKIELSLNRTLSELKHLLDVGFIYCTCSLNRTLSELKLNT